ncbi:MAG: CTQ-dependent lysine 6-oxidase LodA [Roseibium sp.]|uniref:CTQ-dependent lysine 6-oxidase LodA n=1 Tax=Roseibium sp. TaxID=1936156 RepID=UPI0026170091|nr:CTQ-dependent lysine 6-oxidase LodA [Roseibium sp.]MCV0429133.1 CTQ-dependent lysine 6-oxidase LodA [Roseibium sp.]
MDQSRRQFLELATGAALAPGLVSSANAQDSETGILPSTTSGLKIHPAIGIARLGDSGANLDNPFEWTETYYAAPEEIGGLPLEFDPRDPSSSEPVNTFKDKSGQIRRQAALFRIYRDDGKGGSVPVSLNDEDIRSIRWSVHIANKKAAWYGFSEFRGNLMFGEQNSYANIGVDLRNSVINDETERQKRLIIDPGPRSVSTPGDVAHFNSSANPDVSSGYGFVSFPGRSGISKELGFSDNALYPYEIKTLGQMTMDTDGGLAILGGYGNVGGPRDEGIHSFAGADGFFDDTSDGSVRAHVTLTSGEELTLEAWVIVAPPKVAPELINITTLDDIVFDMAVRHKGAAPEIFEPAAKSWNQDFVVSFDRDILPVLERMRSYQWVADVAPMVAYATPPFDMSDPSETNRGARETWFNLLRSPEGSENWELAPDHQKPMNEDGFPLMPLNSGSNSVTNHNISKFMSLTPTQYFFFKQWAAGRFEKSGPRRTAFQPNAIDRGAIGNCVGAPMSPGIEVTWSVRNPILFRDDDPYRLLAQPSEAITEKGLSPTRDETEGGGCQPGDLTKRMAAPWQTDFFLCGAQPVSFKDPLINKRPEGSHTEHLPPPPTFNASWWPPQSPLFIYSGADTENAQVLDGGISMAERTQYQRGINTFMQAILAWRYLGFVTNRNEGPDAEAYPFFTENEREHARFRAAKAEFTNEGKLRIDIETEDVPSEKLSRWAFPLHYYVGPE